MAGGMGMRWGNPQLNSRLSGGGDAINRAKGTLKATQSWPLHPPGPKLLLTGENHHEALLGGGLSLELVNLASGNRKTIRPYSEQGTVAYLAQGLVYSSSSECLSLNKGFDYLPWSNQTTRLWALHLSNEPRPVMTALYQNYGWHGALDQMKVYAVRKFFGKENLKSTYFLNFPGLTELSPARDDGSLVVWFKDRLVQIDPAGQPSSIERPFAARSLSILSDGSLVGVVLEEDRPWLVQLGLDGAEQWRAQSTAERPVPTKLNQPPVCLGGEGLLLVEENAISAWKAGTMRWTREVSNPRVIAWGERILVATGPSLLGWDLGGEEAFRFDEPEGRPCTAHPSATVDGKILVATDRELHVIDGIA